MHRHNNMNTINQLGISNHPVNLMVRFLLELALLTIFFMWGWHQFTGAIRYCVAVGLPLLVAGLWGIFRVDGDPGKAPVRIPGWLRLLYEILLFTTAGYFLFCLKLNKWAIVFCVVSLIHYQVSWQRVRWLLYVK
jgi:hypothetical protein